MDAIQPLAMGQDDFASLLTVEHIEQVKALGEGSQVRFQCHLDIDQSVIGTYDAVLETSDREGVISDPTLEVQRRLDEIIEKRTLLLSCIYENAEGFDVELFNTPISAVSEFASQFVSRLRQQIEDDVRREIEWTTLGTEGQDAALSTMLNAADEGTF